MLQSIRQALRQLRREYARTQFRSQLPLRGYANNRVAAEWVDTLSDEDLSRLNELLDWQCFTADSQGRRFGSAAWKGKRTEPQVIPDRRIVLLNDHFDLSDKHVLEIGCFEGVHTIGLAKYARQVTAVDSRIENVVRTIVRCSFFGFAPRVFKCDVEGETLPIKWLSSDILHHVGVLYHLKDPVRHLLRIGQYVRLGLMLDTHYCRDEQADQTYEVEQRTYRYREYTEHGLTDPFSGMHQHAKWLRQDDIITVLRQSGFQQVDVIETREERNGPRLLLIAKRLRQ
jgi:tRNA (mo5U34)-methyltransferase